VLVLILANFVDLTAIASLGSVVALALFLVVSVAALRLRAETESNVAMIVAAIAATAVILVVFSIQTLRDAPETFVGMIAILVLAVGLDLVWARMRKSRTAALESAAAPAGPPDD
jgi:hypothetical protein